MLAHFLLAQNDAGSAVVGVLFMLIPLVITLIVIAGLWKLFVKAGKPGWAAIVPIYNLIVLLEIAGRPLWWFVLLLLPFVNMIFAIILSLDIARRFGKGPAYGIGLALLAPIFYPLLGFSDARFQPSA